jgi:hypothetical protein
MISNLMVSIGNHTNIELDENLIRHMFLMSLRKSRKKFKDEYGEMVICVDGKNSWRRQKFPYYKANRRSGREKSEIDWDKLFEIIGNIRMELQEFFPYKTIYVDDSEADDIIGVVCHKYGTPLNNGSEKFLILSGDKDYIQLQTYANVDQYNPVMDKYVRHDDPEKYLSEHILKGDSGDGVPNILSADNALVLGIRQKPMTKKRIELYRDGNNLDEELAPRYERNKMLIDLAETPEDIKQKILEQYETEKAVGRSKLFNYFVSKKLKNLLTDIQDF